MIIGNGYDLSLALKTSYKDFVLSLYKKYLTQSATRDIDMYSPLS